MPRCRTLALLASLTVNLLTTLAAAAAAAPSTGVLPMTALDRDRAAILETVENVARGADLHQWDVVRASFAPSVTLNYGTPETLSPGDIVERWEPLLEAFDATQHALSDVIVQVDGDAATARSRFRATHLMKGAAGGDVWTLEGRYEHRLVRAATGWKITAMTMTPEASSGNAGLLELAQQRAAAGTVRARNRRIVQAFFERLEAFDIEGFVALFAPDGRQSMPFSPAGFPTRLEGRDAIRNQYRGLPENFTSMRFPDRVVRDLADPTMFVATYRGSIALKSGGRYDNTYIGLFTVRDGQIVEFVEYFNPITLQDAFGAQLTSNFNVR